MTLNTNINSNQCGETIKMVTPEVASKRWYIYRYHGLSNHLKEQLDTASLEVFFPHRRVWNPSNSKTRIVIAERPMVPGYIFVHSTLQEALELGKELDIFLWQKRNFYFTDDTNHSVSDRYYSIPDKVMKRFIRVVECCQEDIELFDATDIDLQQNDEVEFISGPLKGQRGYVRTESRKAGGLVIVPLAAKDAQQGDADQIDAADTKPFFHYGVHAEADSYRIVKFANNERSSRNIKHANANVKACLKAFAEGSVLAKSDEKRLKGYALRYAEVQMSTDIQRANLALLLYRVYTILEAERQKTRLMASIQQDVMPAFEARISNARGEHKASATRQKADFLLALQHADDAVSQRQECLEAQRMADEQKHTT